MCARQTCSSGRLAPALVPTKVQASSPRQYALERASYGCLLLFAVVHDPARAAACSVMQVTHACMLFSLFTGLLAEIEAKAAQPEYGQLLQDCKNVYCSIRQQVRRATEACSMLAWSKPTCTLTAALCCGRHCVWEDCATAVLRGCIAVMDRSASKDFLLLPPLSALTAHLCVCVSRPGDRSPPVSAAGHPDRPAPG